MSCPAPESLVPYASGKHDDAMARHVAECPNCQSEVARLRESAAELRADTITDDFQRTPDCLDPLTLAQLVDGSPPADARPRAVGHLATCARCRQELAAINAMRRDIERQSSSGMDSD